MKLLLRSGPRLATWVFPPRSKARARTVKVIVVGVEPRESAETKPRPPPWRRRELMREVAVPPELASPSSSGAQVTQETQVAKIGAPRGLGPGPGLGRAGPCVAFSETQSLPDGSLDLVSIAQVRERRQPGVARRRR